MNSIINFFLRIKHWQLFILIYTLPIIFYINQMSYMLDPAWLAQSEDYPEMLLENFKYFAPMMVVLTLFYYGWYWSVAMGLQSKLPPYVLMKVNKFKWFFLIPFFYMLCLAFGMELLFSSYLPDLMNGEIIPDLKLILIMAIIIVPIHFFSIFGIFYSMYFIAKTIRSVELQRETRFEDFIGEFFLIWFFPIGVWILQPRINKLAEGKDVFHERTV